MAKNHRFNTDKSIHPENDLGLGNQLTGNYRLLDENGKFKAKRKGKFFWHPYQDLLEMSWFRFHLVIFLFYAVVNALFAFIYYNIGVESLSGEHYNDFFSEYFKCYFFSVQTLTTVGYGAVAPLCFLSNVVAAFEALTGLLIFALITGLYYAKFTRPKAKILYSSMANISPFKDGINGVMFRMVNQRNTDLIDVAIQLTLSWVEDDPHGVKRRHFQPLELERSKIALFPLNWTIVHPITETSPFYRKKLEDFKDINAELMAFVTAYDITFGQMVQSRKSYQYSEMNWAKKFLPMYYADEKYGSIIEYEKINDVQDMDLFDYV
jgi:inward rectifier potassium channel